MQTNRLFRYMSTNILEGLNLYVSQYYIYIQIRSCIVGCYRTEDHFLEKEGAFLLLDLLSVSSCSQWLMIFKHIFSLLSMKSEFLQQEI